MQVQIVEDAHPVLLLISAHLLQVPNDQRGVAMGLEIRGPVVGAVVHTCTDREPLDPRCRRR